MDSKEFNLWDLDRINIRVKEEFLKKLNEKINNISKRKTNAYKILFKEKEILWISFKNMLKPSYTKNFFVPLKIYLKICEKLNISREELQESVIAYKTTGGPNYILNPILPIKITPVFHMIFAHNIGDGTVINPKKGRLPYFGYRQFDKFYRLGFIKKLESIFGNIIFKEDYIEKSTRPYCPPAISTLFFKYYNLDVNGFKSLTSRVSEKITDKDSLLAVLIAFIIDEGHVDSTQITIVLKNKFLIEDLGKICDKLCYEFKITYRNNETYQDYGYLNILRKGMKKLYEDYKDLHKRYSVIDLGWKGEKILKSFKISERKIFKVKGNENLILEIMKENHISVNQLAAKINMTRQGVRYHIHNLLKQKKIRLIDYKQLNWKYGI
jgi:biotin operon repressor